MISDHHTPHEETNANERHMKEKYQSELSQKTVYEKLINQTKEAMKRASVNVQVNKGKGKKLMILLSAAAILLIVGISYIMSGKDNVAQMEKYLSESNQKIDRISRVKNGKFVSSNRWQSFNYFSK